MTDISFLTELVTGVDRCCKEIVVSRCLSIFRADWHHNDTSDTISYMISYAYEIIYYIIYILV